MQATTKKDALASGEKSYFTGVPCMRGHINIRSAANGICYQCRRESSNLFRSENAEADRQKSREWYAKNKDRAAAWKRNWIEKNPDKYKARRQAYRANINTRAKEMMSSSKWSAAKTGMPFDIDSEWIKERLERGVCELTGLRFNLTPLDGGRQNPYTASLDRIKPANGYVKSNVRMILWALNAAFNTYGEGVYADIARVFLARNPSVTASGTGLT